MNTHEVCLTIQYLTVSALFVEIWIVFLRWKNPIHSFLFLACIASFISNIGYLFELQAESLETYLTALKLSYAGRVWITFAFFMFAAKMCRIRIPKWLIVALAALHTTILCSVLMIGSNGLYYTSYQLVMDGQSPVFIHQNGVMHDLMMGLNAVYSFLALFWLAREYYREKGRRSRFRYLFLIMSFGIQILCFAMQMTGAFGISKYYDLTMPGALFGTVFLMIGILGFDLLGTREIAKDFVIDRISEGIIAVDNEGRIQYYNEPVVRIYPEFEAFFKGRGKTEEKTAVRTPYDIMDSILEAVRTGGTLTVHDRIYTPEENPLVFGGESYGRLFVLVDDTEHYHYMEEIQQQRDIADQANEAKSRFLASMSHEIRTPINAVIGMDEMILRESNEKEIRAYAADIMSAGKTLLSLINDILDLSKVEEGRMDIIPVQYDLSSLINDLINIIRDRAEKKGLKLKADVDSGIPRFLVGDEIRIRQCVVNLLTNAVKYTEAGEVRLTVSAKKEDDSHILLGFTVEDTGIGMKEEDMEKLFTPYKRIEEKRNRAIEGTGLGMSITRQLLELMGSGLVVHSTYGKGSVFSFEVLQEVTSWDAIGAMEMVLNRPADRLREYRELFHAPEANILVVDDTEMNLTVMKSLLKRTQICIDTAMSGKEAVSLAGAKAYDLIFIDHMMPDMDGIETLQAIRGSGLSKDSPAVALTANAVSGAREMYLSAGFTKYLSKPVDGDKLEHLLLEMLPEDKVLAVSEEQRDLPDSAAPEKESSAVWQDSLKAVEEIDAQAGLKNCGSEEGYRSVLSVFHQTAKDKADEIEALYQKDDFKNLTIKVHALKSSARIIGAQSLSDLAKELEEAGKCGDREFIDGNLEELLKRYRSLDERLSWLDREEEAQEEIGEDALKEAYQTIAEIAGSYDYELMDNMLKSLHGYRLPKKDRERIAEIEKLLTELDWEGIMKKAGEEE